MTRLSFTFECKGQTLAGTLDTAPGKTGLLIVSGGNEIRSGAFGGQARLAAEIAQAGFPTFRFDRRGIGDSDGENAGFRYSAQDIEAAIDAFRAISPTLSHIVAFGNCDAASALMLGNGLSADALILANPWTIEDNDTAVAPSAVRERYIGKLKDPKEILRLLSGGVDLSKLYKGLKTGLQKRSKSTSLARDMADGLRTSGKPAVILLAEADRTAQIFGEHWIETDVEIHRCKGASHSFVEPGAQKWLRNQIVSVLRS